MMTFLEWCAKHNVSRAALDELAQLSVAPPSEMSQSEDKSEAYVQSRVKLEAASKGIYAWRNNVGAAALIDKDKLCEQCQYFAKERPIRWGLANDSPQRNARIKSGDLILGIPTLITPEMVGSRILKFGSRECKREDWHWRGTERELGQLAWATLINGAGGDAMIVKSVGSL